MNFAQDLRFAFRTLQKSPGFLLLAVATLGLGISANTAIFSLFYQVLLRSLPVAEPERLVLFHSEGFQMPGWNSSDNYETIFSYPLYRSLRDGATSFQGIAARSGTSAQISINGAGDRIQSEVVSGNFFDVLGLHPRIGRLLVPSDDHMGSGNPVAVLSFDYWTKRFGANSSVLNQPVTLNGVIFTIAGVAPEGFRGVLSGNAPDIYIPIAMDGVLNPRRKNYDTPDQSWLTLIGRLKPGVTRERAAAELQPIFAATVKDHLARLKVTGKRLRAEMESKRVQLVSASRGLNQLERQWRKPLVVLASMVGLLLLVGCANLANLLLARGVNRSRDTAIRLALGAGRRRIASLLLAESLLVAAGGAILGIALTPVLTSGILRILPEDVAGGWLNGGVSIPVLAFCTLLMVASGIISGLAPAWQSARTDEGSVLGDRSAATSGNHLSPRVRQALVVGQLALSLVLLSTAGLFGKSLVNLLQHNPGFRAENVLTFSVDASAHNYTLDRGIALYREIARRLAALPGVQSVAIAGDVPLGGSESGSNVTVEGYTAADGEDTDAQVDPVGPGFFRTIGTPLIAGREFTESDVAGAPQVVIVNQAFVKRFLHGRDAVGKHMKTGGPGVLDMQIVGVVADAKHQDLREEAKPSFYPSYEQGKAGADSFKAIFLTRSRSDTNAITAEARAVVAQLDRGLPVYDVATMQKRIDDSVYTDRLLAALSTAFGLLALILTAIGLYGVIAYVVSSRTAEIGIRMALGATGFNVISLVLREVALLTLFGAIAGTLCALAAGQAVRSQLFGLGGPDPVLLTVTVLVLAGVSLAAGAVPAIRAARIQPLRALRHE